MAEQDKMVGTAIGGRDGANGLFRHYMAAGDGDTYKIAIADTRDVDSNPHAASDRRLVIQFPRCGCAFAFTPREMENVLTIFDYTVGQIGEENDEHNLAVFAKQLRESLAEMENLPVGTVH